MSFNTHYVQLPGVKCAHFQPIYPSFRVAIKCWSLFSTTGGSFYHSVFDVLQVNLASAIYLAYKEEQTIDTLWRHLCISFGPLVSFKDFICDVILYRLKNIVKTTLEQKMTRALIESILIYGPWLVLLFNPSGTVLLF